MTDAHLRERLDFFATILHALARIAAATAAEDGAGPDAASLDARAVDRGDLFVTLPAAALHPAVACLVEQFDLRHLTTITADARDGAAADGAAADGGGEIWLHYHFWQRVGLTLVVRLPAADPEVRSILDLIPGAVFYEREVHDMFGVRFAGHEDIAPLLLPDDWTGPPPMRRAAQDEES